MDETSKTILTEYFGDKTLALTMALREEFLISVATSTDNAGETLEGRLHSFIEQHRGSYWLLGHDFTKPSSSELKPKDAWLDAVYRQVSGPPGKASKGFIKDRVSGREDSTCVVLLDVPREDARAIEKDAKGLGLKPENLFIHVREQD